MKRDGRFMVLTDRKDFVLEGYRGGGEVMTADILFSSDMETTMLGGQSQFSSAGYNVISTSNIVFVVASHPV